MATTQQAQMTVLGTEPITADQLLEMYGKGMRGELIRGVFCETMAAGMKHGEIVVNLSGYLREIVKPNRLGRLMASDSGVKVESDPDTVREPDIAYFSRERLPPWQTCPATRTFRLTSSSKSIRLQTPRATCLIRLGMWLNAGVRLVWVVWPETQDGRSPPPRSTCPNPPRKRHPNRRRYPPPIHRPYRRHLRRLESPLPQGEGESPNTSRPPVTPTTPAVRIWPAPPSNAWEQAASTAPAVRPTRPLTTQRR